MERKEISESASSATNYPPAVTTYLKHALHGLLSASFKSSWKRLRQNAIKANMRKSESLKP